MHGDAAARLLPELGVEQLEPVVHDLCGGRRSVIKRPILERLGGRREGNGEEGGEMRRYGSDLQVERKRKKKRKY